MRTGRPKEALILTEEERGRLQSMAHRARSQPLLARRARVVLACGDGLDNQSSIAAQRTRACAASPAGPAGGDDHGRLFVFVHHFLIIEH